MSYIYRVKRLTSNGQVVERKAPPAVENVIEQVEDDEPSYRELQAQAKERDIPANQSAEDLKKALEEAEDG